MKVSVIIPNYNHASYLTARLETVLNQTYQDFEVILMDDKSTDNSLAIIEQYRDHPKVRVILNDVNSGSTFKQWNKGVKEAKGEYIWIAESDDYAELTLLEQLVDKLEKYSNVGIAYCQSWAVDEKGNLSNFWKDWTNNLDENRWKKDFVSNGFGECRDYMIHKNTIPNASGVVFKKSVYVQAGWAEETFRFCGDWLMWSKMLLITNVAFVAEPLNYFRTYTVSKEKEQLKVRASMHEKYSVYHYIACKTGNRIAMQQAYEKIFHYWHNYSLKSFLKKDYFILYRMLSKYDKGLNRKILSFIYHQLK